MNRKGHVSHEKNDLLIELKDIKKDYYLDSITVPALRGINLEVRAGEFISIMGPSGSGKSTLMNLIGCLDVPTSGMVKLGGINITEISESDLAQIRGRRIGFIFQMFNLIPTLSARENVTLPMIFQDVPASERDKRAKSLLERFNLGKRMNHLPSQLSGGEQQRVAIARALSMDPPVILADEPTGNLDSKTGKEIMALFGDLHEKEGKTIILITHDMEVARYAEKTIKIKDGRIIDVII
jgi:putative ABC transport system ATP-binding protein